MILTLACVDVDKWVVIEDGGFVSQIRGIEVRPASCRAGSVVFKGNHHDAEMFMANRNNAIAARAKELKNAQS